MGMKLMFSGSHQLYVLLPKKYKENAKGNAYVDLEQFFHYDLLPLNMCILSRVICLRLKNFLFGMVYLPYNKF